MNSIDKVAKQYLIVSKRNDNKFNPSIVKIFQKQMLRSKLEEKSQSKCLDFTGSILDQYKSDYEINVDVEKTHRIDDTDMVVLYDTLIHNTFITHINFAYNYIGDDGCKVISDLLVETNLYHVDLSHNNIGPEGVIIISKGLMNIKCKLRTLILNRNSIQTRGGNAIAEALQLNRTLQSLCLDSCDLGISSIISITSCVNQSETIKILDLSNPSITSLQSEHHYHISKLIENTKYLQATSLKHSKLDDVGAQYIFEALINRFERVTRFEKQLDIRFSTLYWLDLSCNSITCSGVEYVAKLLKYNTSIRVLNLGYNRIKDKGATLLADALITRNTNLLQLSIVSNEIGRIGLFDIAQSFKENSTLKKIYIWGNTIDASIALAYTLLMENCRFSQNCVDFKPYYVDQIPHLAKLENKPTTIMELNDNIFDLIKYIKI